MYSSTVRKYLLINLSSSFDIHSLRHRCKICGNRALNSASIGVSFLVEEVEDDVDVDVDVAEDMERDDGCRFGGFGTYVS